MNPLPRYSLVVTSIASWLVACALPALRFGKAGDYPESGMDLMNTGLLLGWTVLNFAAYANPLLWVGWVQCWRGKCRSARILSGLSMILACQTLQLIFRPCTLMPSWSQKASSCDYWAKPALGLFLWVASMVVIFVAAAPTKEQNSHDAPAPKEG